MIRTIFAATAIAAAAFGAASLAAAQPTTPTPQPGATAQCCDGTWSFSLHRSGTCSHHGGVCQWCPCDSGTGQIWALPKSHTDPMGAVGAVPGIAAQHYTFREEA